MEEHIKTQWMGDRKCKNKCGKQWDWKQNNWQN